METEECKESTRHSAADFEKYATNLVSQEK